MLMTFRMQLRQSMNKLMLRSSAGQIAVVPEAMTANEAMAVAKEMVGTDLREMMASVIGNLAF